MRARALVDETPFLLRDAEQERDYGFNLNDALTRARGGKMLAGWVVAVTPGVRPDEPELAEMVMHAGCAVVGWTQLGQMRVLPVHLLIVSCEEDRGMWEELERVAPGKHILAVKALTVALLRQELKWDEYAKYYINYVLTNL